ARAHRRLARLPHHRDGFLHHLEVETEFVAEVVVHRRDVRPRRPADFPHRHSLESTLGKEGLCLAQDPLATRFMPGTLPSAGSWLAGPRHGSAHSCRLKSSVAAVMANSEKRARKARSLQTGMSPVFLRSRLLSACTA